MLLEIKVKNFAIIDQVALEFEPGMNVISGETGAGKSIVLKALSLLMGEKANVNIVKHGKPLASVEGLFDLTQRGDIREKLQELELDTEDDELVVRRTISTNGKSKVYINGSLCNLLTLRQIVTPLIDISGHSAPLIEMTGQHDNKNLLNRHYHLQTLDIFGQLQISLKEYKSQFNTYREVEREIEELLQKLSQKDQRLDFLKYQQKELVEFDLKPGDELDLEQQYKLAKNSQKILNFTGQAESSLYSADGSALETIQSLIYSLKELSDLAPELSLKSEMLVAAKAQIEEFVFELREYQRKILDNPLDIIQLEKKISQFRKLQKKYGSSISEILGSIKEIESEIHFLENQELVLKEKQEEKNQWIQICEKSANELHKKRERSAEQLEHLVNKELKDLNMKGVEFKISCEKLGELHASGNSQIEFMIRTGKKGKENPLIKTASGGELSRILLSIKRVIGKGQLPRTLLFDEVDTGVSGETAEKVGRKLHEISRGQQLICVTHLPQVAAFGDTHFLIEKSVYGQDVKLSVVHLSQKQRESEIARLISGREITTASRKHAQQLMQLRSR